MNRASSACNAQSSSSIVDAVTLLRSKIHRATVTGASLRYEGSLTISTDPAELVGLLHYEKILVANLSNRERFETYVI